MANVTLDELLDQIVKIEEEFDLTSIWPCSPVQSEAYFGSMLAWKIFNKFQKNENEFSKALDKVPPDILRFHLFSEGLIGLKVARIYDHKNIDVNSSIRNVEVFLESIKRRTYSDPICRDGKNLLLSENQVAKSIKEYKLIEIKTNQEKRLIAGLGITLESASWSVFFDAYRDGGYILHGLYPVSEGLILVRDGYNLQPDVWKTKSFQNKSIKIYALYDRSIVLNFDLANHIRFDKPIWNYLKKVAIVVDNNEIDLDKVEELEGTLEKGRDKQVKLVESFSPMKIINKSYEIYSYLFKSFFDYYQEDWRPTDEEYQKIESMGLKYWEHYSPLEKQKKIRDIYDPRTNIVE